MKLTKKLMVLLFTAVAGWSMVASAKDVSLVEPQNIPVPEGKTYTLSEVKQAIVVGAESRKWHVVNDAPGKLRIQLDGRRDGAVLTLDIVYDKNKYSINYVSSAAIRYSEEGGVRTIHSNYDRWIKNLTDSIDIQLGLLKT